MTIYNPLYQHQSSLGKDAPPCVSQKAEDLGKDAPPCVSNDANNAPPRSSNPTIKDTHDGGVVPKIIMTAVLLLAMISGFAQDSWQRISPLPQEQTLNCVANIPGTDKVIAVGNGATVMISGDVGETWEIIHQPGNVPFDMDFIGVEFLDEDNGFIYGDYQSILKTANGGYSWEVIYQGDTTSDKRILDIEFLDDQRGFMIDGSRELFKTSDGGISWSPVDDVTSTLLTKVAFGSDLNGIIITSDSAIYRTVNGGENWIYDNNPQGLASQMLNDIFFLDDTTVFISGYTPGEIGTNICRSEDKGETWELIYHSWEISEEESFVFFNDSCGVLIIPPLSWAGPWVTVIKTSNGGHDWTKLPHAPNWFKPYHMKSACLSSDSSIVTVGHNGAVHNSHDRGYSWNPYFQQTFSGELSESWVINDTLWRTSFKKNGQFGQETHFYFSTDSAINWTIRGNLCYENVVVDFISPDTAFASFWDNDLDIAKSTDGGYHWTTLSSFTPYWPYSIEFYDSEKGIIACLGFILITNDGGYTLHDVTPLESFGIILLDIEYFSPTKVFVVGELLDEDLSPVWMSLDGGFNWDPVLDLPGSGYFKFYKNLNDNCFLGGINEILKSENEGENWYSTTIHTSQEIEVFDIQFPTAEIGFAVGKGEVRCLKTTDGGENWYPIEIDITSGLKTVHFFDENQGIVMGENGLVLRTDNGGTTFIEEQPAIPAEPSAITLFPNPATDILNITFEDPQQPGELIFYTTDGTEVLRRTHNPNVAGIIMNVAGLDAGTYVVQYVVDGDIVETSKLIIQ